MKKTVMLLVQLMLLLPAAAQLSDAGQIMERCRELSITGSMNAYITLTITEKNGAVRNRTISIATKSYNDGTEKRFIKFMEPADVRGTSMLIVDNKSVADEMWIYLPALKKTRRIVTSDKGKSFMSSEFSNADMSSPTLSDFTHRHLDGSGDGKQWIIESTPLNEDKADEYGYSRKVNYISSDKNQIVKMDLYNFDNKLFKVIEIMSVHPLSEGKYLVKEMIAENLLTDRKSRIIFSNINIGAKVDDSLFSLQNLERQ